MGDKIGNRIARKAWYNRRSMEANSQKENKLVKRWEHFARKVQNSKKSSEIEALLKSFSDYEMFQGTSLYHMVSGILHSYVKQKYKNTAVGNTKIKPTKKDRNFEIPPTERKKITLAQATWFYFYFRFIPHTFYPDDKTDLPRTGIMLARDNKYQKVMAGDPAVYGDGTCNCFFWSIDADSAEFLIKIGQPGAHGEPNPGPVQPLGITYNPDDGTDPDLQKPSAGSRYKITRPSYGIAPGGTIVPAFPGAEFMMQINQFSVEYYGKTLPHPVFHPAWEKNSSVPSINEISSYPYNAYPAYYPDWFREPTWTTNLHYYEDYMDMPPEIEIPAGLPVGYIPSSPFDIHYDPDYWATHAFDEIFVGISDRDVTPMEPLVLIDPLDYGWTNEEVADWFVITNDKQKKFWEPRTEQRKPGTINTVVCDAMENYVVDLLSGKTKVPLDRIRNYIFGTGPKSERLRPWWWCWDPHGNLTVCGKRYILPEKVAQSHANVYTGPFFPVCYVHCGWGGCDGKCII